MTCGCAIDQLCDECLHSMFAHLRGVAAVRGERWAAELATKRRAPWIPWPLDSRMVRETALARIADLTRDERLRAQLIDELVAWAAKRWNERRPAL